MRKQAYKIPVKFIRTAGPLIVLLIFTLGQILFFSAEFVLQEPIQSVEIARVSWRTANSIKVSGFFPSLSTLYSKEGIGSIVFHLPLTILYLVFGFNHLSSISYSLICSLVNLFFIYKIAEHLYGKTAGLVSGFIWGVLPWPILFGGVVSPVAGQFLISLVGVYYALFSQKMGFKSVLISIGALLIILFVDVHFALALFILVLWIVVFYSFHQYLGKFSNILTNRGVVALVIISILTVSGLIPVQDMFDGLQNLFAQPGLFLLIPLILVGGAILLREKINISFLIIWIISGSLGFLALVINGVDFANMFWHPLFLFTLTPLVILMSAYLSRWVSYAKFLRTIPVLTGSIILVFGIVGLGRLDLIPNYADYQIITPHYILLFSMIANGLAVIGIVASPLLFGRRAIKSREIKLCIFLVIFAIGMVGPGWNKISFYRSQVYGLKNAFHILMAQSVDLPIYFSESSDRDFYALLTETELRAHGSDRLRMIQDEIGGIVNAYFVIREGEFHDIPETWSELSRTDAGSKLRYVLFRSLANDALREELSQALYSASKLPSVESLMRLSQAYQNAGESCQAYQVWMEAQNLGAGGSNYIPVSPTAACIQDALGDAESIGNELGQFIGGHRIEGPYLVFELTRDEMFLDDVLWIRQQEARFPDARTIHLTRELEPNAFYIYSIWVRAIEPTYVLYWRIGELESYYDRARYPEWTRLTVLIYSGNDGVLPVTLTFSPALSDNHGFVYLYDVRVVKYNH